MDPETNIHYFHWLLDGYKFLDYEPVQIRYLCGRPIVVSRFHWFVLTVWLEPLMFRNKPVVRFVKAFHTPISLSDSNVHYGELSRLSGEERFWFRRVYIPFLIDQASKSIEIREDQIRGYSDKIVQNKPPKEYEFKLDNMKCYVIVSREPPVPEQLPPDVRLLLWPSHASP